MEYVNKSTGEIVKAEELNLANLNKGELDARFQVEIAKLTKELLYCSGKGSVNICVKAEVACDSSGDITVYLESSVSTKYPKYKLDANTDAKIGENGALVLPKEQPSMFTESEQEK